MDRVTSVNAALRRLRRTAEATQRVADTSGTTLGCADESELWTGDGVTVCFDGVIFDRADRIQEFDLPLDATDAQIVAHAFLKCGELFAERLDGDFALALWHAPEQTLLLARDAMGRRPLFYAQLRDGFCFASEPRGLRGWPGLPLGLDDAVVARILASMPAVVGPTIFRDIWKVRGGEVLVVRPGRESVTLQYWFPLRQPQLRVKDPREVADAVRDAMIVAVGRRLPPEGLVASHLSSGFDSSGVTALAATALARRNRPLLAYTSVPRVASAAHEVIRGRFDNEWPLASEVAKLHPNITHIPIFTDAAEWWEAIDYTIDYAAGPPTLIRNTRWYYGIAKDASGRGATTMLEGSTGNLTGSYNGTFGLYDLRRRNRWIDLVRAVAKRRQHGAAWSTMVHDIWSPSLAARARVDRLRGRPVQKLFDQSAMRPEFYRESGLPQQDLSAMIGFVEGDRTNGRTWRASIVGRSDSGLMTAAMRRRFGMTRADPTADRRLVELCLSIPDEGFAPRGEKRGLYRDAFREILPASVLQERQRGLQGSDLLEQMEPWIPDLYRELELQQESPGAQRFLDLPRLRRILNDWATWKAGPRKHADAMFSQLFGSAISFGRFVRKLEEEDRKLAAIS